MEPMKQKSFNTLSIAAALLIAILAAAAHASVGDGVRRLSFDVFLDDRAIGYQRFSLTPTGDGTRIETLAQFEEAVRRFPEVQECYMLMGEMDFLLKVVTRDVASYEAFLRGRLSRLAAVGEVRSSMALTPVKESTSLPLELVAVAGEGHD